MRQSSLQCTVCYSFLELISTEIFAWNASGTPRKKPTPLARIYNNYCFKQLHMD